MKAIIIAHILIIPPVRVGHIEIIVKKIANTIPKLRSEPIFDFFFISIKFNITK